MQKIDETLDFRAYVGSKEIDTKIKQSRDDMLHIIQAELKAHDSKVEASIANVKADIKALESNVKADIRVLDAKIENLADTTSTELKRLDEKFDSLSRLIKWVVGIFVTIILGYIALMGTDIASLFGG